MLKAVGSLGQTDIFLLLLGVCCASLKDNKALMKMGLGLVLVSHVTFILGALVHGAVLRHITVFSQPPMKLYAIANIIVIIAGLVVSRTCINHFVSMYVNPKF